MWEELTRADPICNDTLYINWYKTSSQKHQTTAGNPTWYDKYFKIAK